MAKRNLIVLVLANALLGAQMPMMFTIAGLAGQSLASECLLRHLADHHDSAGVNAECVPFVDVDATLQPPGWVLDRGGGRNARRFDQRLCFVRWVVCNISNRQLFQRHLYVCTGVFTALQQPMAQRQNFVQRLFPM